MKSYTDAYNVYGRDFVYDNDANKFYTRKEFLTILKTAWCDMDDEQRNYYPTFDSYVASVDDATKKGRNNLFYGGMRETEDLLTVYMECITCPW